MIRDGMCVRTLARMLGGQSNPGWNGPDHCETGTCAQGQNRPYIGVTSEVTVTSVKIKWLLSNVLCVRRFRSWNLVCVRRFRSRYFVVCVRHFRPKLIVVCVRLGIDRDLLMCCLFVYTALIYTRPPNLGGTNFRMPTQNTQTG